MSRSSEQDHERTDQTLDLLGCSVGGLVLLFPRSFSPPPLNSRLIAAQDNDRVRNAASFIRQHQLSLHRLRRRHQLSLHRLRRRQSTRTDVANQPGFKRERSQAGMCLEEPADSSETYSVTQLNPLVTQTGGLSLTYINMCKGTNEDHINEGEAPCGFTVSDAHSSRSVQLREGGGLKGAETYVSSSEGGGRPQ
ncbi:unnamed protein product [Pleuronectes platessa]|uniref:Uncharacterized protein n=1 Tax=Pleuronectes platessa TaxID=8262 RepID=A0A9N7Y8C8_PLEPL|nr:unnamed protein product [Pleuronectes platessa]